MSRNSSYPKNKKSQSAKPYDVEKSIVKRLTSRMTEFLPRLGLWFGSEDRETNHVDIAEAAEEATHRHHNSEQVAPPQKRARTDFVTPESQTNFSDTNNLSLSAIQYDLGEPSGLSRRPDIEPQAGPSRMPSVVVAGPSGVRRVVEPSSSGMHRVAVPGPSGVVHRRQPVASSTPAVPRNVPTQSTSYAPNHVEVNGDNMSDSSESTSGCSSLVPQGGRSEVEPPKSNTLKLTLTSSFGKQPLHDQRSLFSMSNRDVSRPQPPAASKRPSFDVSIMSGPSRPSSAADKADLTLSPFYAGKTCYGGASAYTKTSPTSKVTNVSYDSIVNNSASRSPSKFRGLNSLADLVNPRRIQISPAGRRASPLSTTQSEPSEVSCLSKRILETLETLSSPVSDCSRIPLDDCGLGGPLKRKRPADDMYDYHSPQPPRQAGPPITPLRVPTVHELMKMKLMQSKILDSTDSARKLIKPKNKPAWQENKVSYSLRQDEESGSRHTNKMKRERKIKQRGDVDEEEMPEEVHLPNISLTMSSLPKFDMPPFSSSSTPPVSAGDDLNFTFSSPIVVLNPNKTPNKNNFKISPISNTNSKPVNNTSISQPLNFNWQNKCNNIPSKDSVEALNTKSENKQHNGEPVPSNVNSLTSLSAMFKPDPGSWSCEVCDIRNKSDVTSCVACTSPKPSVKASLLVSPPTPLPLTSGFGSQFSKSGKWECDGCMMLNENSLSKCPACDTPNPKAPKDSSSKTSVPQLGFGDAFKKPSTSWECSVCLVVNTASASRCISCESQKDSAAKGASITSQFSFGIPKTSTTDTKPSTTFKFGIEKADASVKLPETTATASFGLSKPFSFGIPTKEESSPSMPKAVTSNVDSGISKPAIFTMPTQLKPAVTSAEKKPVFSSNTVPKSDSSPSLKRSSDSEFKSIKFGTPPSESASPKSVFPVNEVKSSEKLPVLSGFPSRGDEPASKKSFTFSPVTSKSEEPAKLSTPMFMFGSNTGTSQSNDTASFMFKTESSSEVKTDAALFKFGSSGTAATSGTGFSTSTFGSKPEETKPSVGFGAKVTEVSEPNKLFGFTASDNKSKPPAYGSAAMFGTGDTSKPSLPMFSASATTSAPAFGTISTPTTSKPAAFAAAPAFGATNAASATSFESSTFGTPAAANSTFGTPATTNSTFGTPTATSTFGTPATTNSAFGASTTSTFGTPATTVAATGSTFGATTTASVPMFGAAATITTSNAPAFSAPSSTFGTPKTTASSNAMFGASNQSSSIFGAPATATTPSFGAPATSVSSSSVFGTATASTAAPNTSMFGAPANKAVTFGDAAKTSATPSANFAFGSKPQAAAATNTSSPAPFQFSAGTNAPAAPAVGGFAFGTNTGAPANQSSFGFPANNSGFGSSFPAVKPAEPAPMFGATPTPGFGSAPAPTPSFGTTTPQFGDNNNAFQTPNFGFGSTQPTPGGFNFSAGQNASGGQNAGPMFAFGQGQQQQQQQQATAAPPQFNPNIRPSFNFTGNTGATNTPVFSATPNPQSGNSSNVQQRRFKRATRRITQTPR